MKSLFQRVLPKSFRSAPEPEAAPAASKSTAASPPDHTSDTVVGAVLTAASTRSTTTAVRRPLISTNGDVAGFDIGFDAETVTRLDAEADPQAIADHVAAVLVAARLVTLGGRVGMARLPAAWLVHAAVPKDESGTVIALESDITPPSDESLQAIATAVGLFQFAGARMAWEGGLNLGIPPEFGLLRQSGEPLGALLESVHRLPALFKHKPLIVLNLSNLEDLEQVLHAGATFVSGALASPATQAAVEAVPAKDKKPLQPEVRHVSHLLQRLAADADSAEIISDLKGDLGLSVQLLQRINSASFAHLGGVASIEQAVAMLGRQELQRWLSLILMQFAVKRKTSPALQEVALWRSRFVELLAQERGEAEPGQLFTLGLASMLGLLLKISQNEVVTTLGLPLMGQQALLSHAGPWAGYLRTAKDVEAHKLTDELAEGEGFTDAARVLALSDEAWVWAATHSDRGGR